MKLNDIMEFDHVIRVGEGGAVTPEPGVYAPEVYMVVDSDGQWNGKRPLVEPGWELLNGYSGQQSYSGPVMHESEYIGGGMERDILATPGVYVAVVVYTITDSTDEDIQTEDAGWAVARKEEK